MSEESLIEQTVEAHAHHSHTPFFVVWGALLALTAVEVLLAYEQLQAKTMLSILLVLSFVKAALIILYFMHMKFEMARMRRVMMIALVICLGLMSVFFADALRIVSIGVH
jgi:cytochrome c oxidase subunit 4